jgi:hypothetical protein
MIYRVLVLAFAALHLGSATKLNACADALTGCGLEASQLPLVGSLKNMKMKMLKSCLQKQGLANCLEVLLESNHRNAQTLQKKKKGGKKAGGKKGKKAGGKKGKKAGGKKAGGKKGQTKSTPQWGASDVPQGFYKLEKVNVPGHNNVDAPGFNEEGATVEACAAACMKLKKKCISFDWKPDDNSCSLSTAVSPKAPHSGDLYIKIGMDNSVAALGELCGDRVGGVKCSDEDDEELVCTSGFGEDKSFSVCVGKNSIKTGGNGGGQGGENRPQQGGGQGKGQAPPEFTDQKLGEACATALPCNPGLDCTKGKCVEGVPDGYAKIENMIVRGNDDIVVDEVASIYKCSSRCESEGASCLSFDYQADQKKCFLSKATQPRDASVTGTLYLKEAGEVGLGQPCGGPVTCSSRFTCTDGFGEDGTSFLCAHKVPTGYKVLRGHNIPGENIAGQNIKVERGDGVQKCADACNRYGPGCKTFDYKADTSECNLSGANTGYDVYRAGALYFKESQLNDQPSVP